MAADDFRPPDNDKTLVVELTPPGRGAIAVVRIAGPTATRIVSKCFIAASGRPLQDTPIGHIALGRWGDADGEELVVCRRGDEEIEVHCHGGVVAVDLVIAALVERGCRRIGWRDWVHRTAPDPLRAAAQIALANARTARTAAILLDQYHGALTAAIDAAGRAIANDDWQQAAATIEAVLAFRALGLHLTTPWKVVLAGPPNVGKSSLMNALAGYQRAIVAPTPGTTRDVVTLITAIDGWPIELADTAGLRAAGDEIEGAGVALAAAALAAADLVLLVRDATTANWDELAEPEVRSPSGTRAIGIWNKIDLVAVAQRPSFRSGEAILTSAVTGEGIGPLVAAIGRALVPVAHASGAALAFTGEQQAALDDALAAVRRRDASAAAAALSALLAP